VGSLTIESNRSLGGAAAVLFSLGIISAVSSILQYLFSITYVSLIFVAISGILGFLGFVAFILFLVAMHGFSRDYAERKIFDYLLYGLIITIVAALIAGILGVLLILLPSLLASTAPSANAFSYLVPIISLVSIIWIVSNFRALNLLSEKSGVPLFRTGAKVLLASALVTVVLEIIWAAVSAYLSVSYNSLTIISVPGAIVQGVAWVLLAKAYYRITPPAPQIQPLFQTMPPPALTFQGKYNTAPTVARKTPSTPNTARAAGKNSNFFHFICKPKGKIIFVSVFI
jgi:uncharacterized membrane protein